MIRSSQREILSRAVVAGENEKVEEIINLLGQPQSLKDESLILAASKAPLATVGLLLQMGADPHARGEEAFRMAIAEGRLPVVKFMLQQDQLKNKENINFLFDLSVEYNRRDLVVFFLEMGVEVTRQDNEALLSSVYKGHLQMVDLLLKRGAQVNARSGLALKWALYHKRADMVALLLINGATIDVRHYKILPDHYNILLSPYFISQANPEMINEIISVYPNLLPLFEASRGQIKRGGEILNRFMIDFYYKPGSPGSLEAKKNFETYQNL